MELIVKEIHRSGTKQAGRGVVEVGPEDSVHNYIDKAVIQSSICSKVQNGNCNKSLNVLKITNLETGKSIWREMCAYGMSNVTKDVVAVDFNSVFELGVKDGVQVKVEKGCCWCFYWHHPVHATRISFQMGVFTCIISCVVSVLASFIFSF